ncbi:MAG: F0F1 ATP synthase subunit B [bacterium]|nr:F0F1 ATP synthase subunit B [bacterium]
MVQLFEDPAFWVAVAFVIAVAIAAKPLSSMIITALDRRSGEIARKLDEANALNEEAKELLSSYRRKHREAEAEIADIMARAREEAETLKRNASRELQAKLAQRRQAAQERIRQAEADAVNDVREAAVDLALGATARLIQTRLDDSEQSRLVGEAIDELDQRLA